jgi:pimeloyl-ACP methyl ester carboxylesterase
VIEASRAGTFVDDVLVPQLRDPAASLLPNGLAGCCYTRPRDLPREALACYLAPLAASPERKDQLHRYCVALDRNPLVALEGALRRSQVPMRVVWGTGDVIFSRESPYWLDRTFPRSRGVRIVEGANLFFPEEMPDLIAEEARRLWLGE